LRRTTDLAEAVPGEAAGHERQRMQAVRVAGGAGADEPRKRDEATHSRAQAGDTLR